MVNMVTGGLGGEIETNLQGEFHCFNCRATTNWAYDCPQLTADQQGKLHMNLEAQVENKDQQEETHQLLTVVLLQACSLPDNQAYLDRCSTVTAFKAKKYLENVKTMPMGIKINCNTGAVSTNQKGKYERMKAWHLPNGVANIVSMHELKKLYRITYDCWEGFYIIHTPQGHIEFHKNE
jgi:hypothetical protein